MKRRTLPALLLAICLSVSLLSGCHKEEGSSIYAKRGQVQRGTVPQVVSASTAEAVRDCLKQAEKLDDLGRESVLPPRDPEAGKDIRLPDPDNTLMAAEGGYIYMIDSYGLIAIQADGASSRLLSYTQVPMPETVSARRLFVRGNRAAIVCSQSVFGTDENGNLFDSAQTDVMLLDVSDPVTPRQIGRVCVDGTLQKAGFLKDALCLVTRRDIWNPSDIDDAEQLLPWVEENGSRSTLRPADIYLRPEPARASLSVITALHLEDGGVADVLALTDATDAAVFAADGLYLARSRWLAQSTEPDRDKEPPYTVVSNTHELGTEVLRLEFDANLKFTGSCSQQGALTENSSMSVYDGVLRLALQTQTCRFSTYTDEKHGWTNYMLDSDSRGSQIVLLDAALQNEAGSALRELGGEQGLRACRFVEDHAFLVTEKPEDPICCADLSDAKAPAIVENLRLTADSARFYEMGSGVVLVLAETTEGAVTLSVYDGKDAAQLRQTDSLSLGQSTQALDVPELVFADPQSGFVGLPLKAERTAYRLYRIEGGKLKEKGTAALEYVPHEARGVMIDGLLYICSPGEVYVIEPESAKLLATVSNAVG